MSDVRCRRSEFASPEICLKVREALSRRSSHRDFFWEMDLMAKFDRARLKKELGNIVRRTVPDRWDLTQQAL